MIRPASLPLLGSGVRCIVNEDDWPGYPEPLLGQCPAERRGPLRMSAAAHHRDGQPALVELAGRQVGRERRCSRRASREALPPLPRSRCLREYVEEKIVDFARQNPGIVVYVNPKNCRIPTLVAEYLNGTVKEEPLTSKTAEEIADIVQKMVNQSGLEIIRIRKPFHTDNPSIQGQWHPFTNKASVLNVQTIGAKLQSLEK